MINSKTTACSMNDSTLLITPPMTQLNTPYPGTAYLCRYLRDKGFAVEQADLGIELIHSIFSADFLTTIFGRIEENDEELSEDAERIFRNRKRYINTVASALSFLQGKQQTLANRIVTRKFLPEGSRFDVIDQLPTSTFGELTIHDRAKFYATLYLEDLAQFIQETASEHFECTRYAEKISASLPSFTPMQDFLEQEPDCVALKIIDLLGAKITEYKPSVVGLSIPFPGNLYAGLLCARHIKKNYPDITIVLGGGYVNTELRELSDTRLFKHVDYVTLDDGEIPFERILQKLSGQEISLCRTFYKQGDTATEQRDSVYYSGEEKADKLSHDSCGWPDYDGLDMGLYLNTFDMANPMNRLWSDGRWNKLTIAHGCYWKRCTFCDVNLDYISRYSEAPAVTLCDRMEEIIAQTGETGFHFVDEACPPALIVELCLEILKRGLQVSWWGNIRFEKAYTLDVARLMAEAGCIAVSGGLEVAEERLLKLIKKGTRMKQVVQSTTAFKEAGIMVHAYLMYGFPTQTNRETIEALENVRQLFENKLLDSAFWHRFSLTAHSPIYQDPDAFGIKVTGPKKQGFSFNDVTYQETGNPTDHSLFTQGLHTAVYNFMHGQCLDNPVNEWFDFKMPHSKTDKLFVKNLKDDVLSNRNTIKDQARLVWVGAGEVYFYDESAVFETSEIDIVIDEELGEWLSHLLNQLEPGSEVIFGDLRNFYSRHFDESTFDSFLESDLWKQLRKAGLLVL